MGPFVFLNVALVGFFAFAAIYHFFLWWSSRREALLVVFSVDCGFRAALGGVLATVATTTTPLEAHGVLRIRVAIALLMSVTWLWSLSLVSGVRARWFVWLVTVLFLSLFPLQAFLFPLNATVLSVEQVTMPWGETISNPLLGPPGWWFAPIYTVVVAIELFGLWCGWQLCRKDRVAGILVLTAACGTLLVHVVHILRGYGIVATPFFGLIPHVLWVCAISLLIARGNWRTRMQLVASEQRFRGTFDQTFQFIGLLKTDGCLVEANRTALEFSGIREEDVIGKPFWEGPWWSHSPDLQNRLRRAVRDAAEGQTVRFEATHPRPDGKLAYVDFSLKPLRSESGEITLLIPEGRDITDRKQAELSLRESSEFNRQIIASVTDGLIVMDKHFKYQVWNPGMERISGLAAEDVIGKSPQELFPFLKEAGVLASLERALAGETVASPDFSYIVPTTGNTGWTSQSMGPLRSADGVVNGVITTVREVTDRIHAKMALRASEARYRTLVEYAPEAIVVLDATRGTFVDVNQNACRLFGMSREELLRHGPQELSPVMQPDGLSSSESSREKIALALAGGAPRFAWVHRDASGRDIPCEVSLVRLPSETSDLIRGSLVDVTERKRAEALLRQKDAELRRLFESNLVGIMFWNADGTITEANDYFLNLVGYSREDHAAGKVQWNSLTPPEYQTMDERALEEIRETGKCTPIEKEFIHKNGGRVPALVGAAAFEGETDHGVAFILDLTQRKRLEQQFRQAQKMEAIGQLAGGIAHDFNNLITIIDGYCELLLERFAEEHSVRPFLGEISKAANRAAMLTRQLLAFSRRQLLTPKVLNFNTVIREIESILQRLIGEDVTLITAFDPALGQVKADPGQLEQILMNMAVNARDAMPRGGTLTLRTSSVSLNDADCMQRDGLRPGPYCLLTVSDTGIGMDELTKTHLFEPFFTTKELGKGTGLGLATVHGIVKQSGGDIEVESEPGRGATFRIYLPTVDEPLTSSETPAREIDIPRGSEVILLVEDEQAVRSLLRQFLTSCGYTVLEAENGQEAITIAESNRQIELLVSDVVMPFIGGRELAERITQLCPDCKVLLLSGYTDDALIRHGVLESQFEFLQKPFTQLRLAQKVREILG